MEDSADISDLLERCRDKAFVNRNRVQIEKCILRLREQVTACLSSKRNLPVLRLLEMTGTSVCDLLPSLEDRRNINQYVYSTYYYLHRIGAIDRAAFEDAKKCFRCMRNCENMFLDTEGSFITSRIEADRRRFKVLRRESRTSEAEELQSLLAELPDVSLCDALGIRHVSPVDTVFVINLDLVFSTDSLHQSGEDARMRISEIRNALFRDVRKDSLGEGCLESMLSSLDRSRYTCTPLFFRVDSLLGNRITRLYGLINKLRLMQRRMYLVSTCSLSQILAELLFFEYFCVDVRSVVSLRDASPDVFEQIQKREEARVVVVADKEKPMGADMHQIGHRLFEKMVEMMHRRHAQEKQT